MNWMFKMAQLIVRHQNVSMKLRQTSVKAAINVGEEIYRYVTIKFCTHASSICLFTAIMQPLHCPGPGCSTTVIRRTYMNDHIQNRHVPDFPRGTGGNMKALQKIQQAVFSRWLQKNGYPWSRCIHWEKPWSTQQLSHSSKWWQRQWPEFGSERWSNGWVRGRCDGGKARWQPHWQQGQTNEWSYS